MSDGGSGDTSVYTFTNPDAAGQSVAVSIERCTGCIEHGLLTASGPTETTAGGLLTVNETVLGGGGQYAVIISVTLPTSEQPIVTTIIQSLQVPDSVTSSPTTTTVPSTTTVPAAAAGCPTADQLFAAWQANPGIETADPGTVTGFSDVYCWQNWVAATVVGNGNGQFIFSQTGGLHGISSDEDNQLVSEVCSDPSAVPAGWSGGPGAPVDCSLQ